MPKHRFINHAGISWRLSDLAREHHLLPQTLASRLDRGLPVARALATGICTTSQSGRRGAAAWSRSHRALFCAATG